MIVLTGANGRLGRLVAEEVLKRVPAERVAVSVRDPHGAAALAERGVDVRHGDFSRPETLPAAFAGAERLLIVSSSEPESEPRRAQHSAAITAAARAGVGHIVFTSWHDLGRCRMAVIEDFPGTERELMVAGPAWTLLRHVLGIDGILARDVQMAIETGELAAPAGTGRATLAGRDDLAAAVAAVMTGDGHENRAYELTGPDTVDWNDLATLASERAGREIPYRPIEARDARASMLAASLPPMAVDALLSVYESVRAGWGSRPPGDLSRLLGRPVPSSLEVVKAAQVPTLPTAG